MNVQQSTAPASIDTVIFDIGRVLIQFSFEDFRTFLVANGATLTTVQDFIDRSELLAYEHGRLTSERFLEKVQGLLGTPTCLIELTRRWQEVFSPIPEMLELARSLRPRYRVLLMSNTNELHWQHLDQTYALSSLADGVITSFAARAMKPDPAIYAFAEQRFAVSPHRTVFVDDIEQNVLAAIERGWHGVLHRGVAETKRRLDALEVKSGQLEQ